VLLLDSLREVATQEGESAFFAPEYAALLGDEAAVRRELKEHPARLELLHQVVESGFTEARFSFDLLPCE